MEKIVREKIKLNGKRPESPHSDYDHLLRPPITLNISKGVLRILKGFEIEAGKSKLTLEPGKDRIKELLGVYYNPCQRTITCAFRENNMPEIQTKTFETLGMRFFVMHQEEPL